MAWAKRIERNLELCLLVWIVTFQYYCDGLSEVKYDGRKYVPEGFPFNISCLKSAYGISKWTKNGLEVNSLDPGYTVQEENLPQDVVRMELEVENAFWKDRGEYKCDALSSKSHTIEIVPLKESDQEMRKQARVQLRPNRTLKLVCDQEENAVFPINWYKDGSRILEDSEKDPRIRMEARTLWISRSNESDAGEYTCVIEMSGLSYPFADHLGSRIKVTYPARVQSFPPQIRPIFDRNLSLECGVQGFPTPRVDWLIDGIPIEMYRQNDTRFDVMDNWEGLPGSVLFLQDVQYEDDHQVTCIAENMDGAAETSTLLDVRENAISTNEEIQGKGIILTPGVDLVLQCNDTDDENAKISWQKNGMPLNATDTRIEEIPSDNILSIKGTVESDCGNYTCSSRGLRAIIAVRSLVKLAPVDHSRNVVQNQFIVLTCNVTQGTPAPVISWYKDEESLNMSDPRVSIATDDRGIEGTQITISDARFEDRATYTCIAANEISSVNATILVRVKDKYAALWPFLGICAEVAVLCTIIFIYEKRRQKPDFDESETEQNTENKNVPDQEDKNRDVRQRK